MENRDATAVAKKLLMLAGWLLVLSFIPFAMAAWMRGKVAELQPTGPANGDACNAAAGSGFAVGQFMPLTPWASIGGCGAGGSGGAAGGSVKWIGRGVNGGLLDVQVLSNLEIGQTRRNFAFTPRFTVKPTYTTQLALSFPVMSKEALFQPTTTEPGSTEITGGVGDLLLDFSKSFGMTGEYSFMATLTFPTGQYDIVRGSGKYPQVLSNMLQLGGGVYTASLGLGYTRDFDRGMLLVDCILTHPYMLNFSGKNSKNDKASGGWGYNPDLMTGAIADEKRRFDYYFKPYGENDLGGYVAPSGYLAVYYGDKSNQKYVTSYGLTLSVPFGVTWIPGYDATKYNPIPDPDFQTWSGTLQYGIEFSDPDRPIYLVVAKQIHDKTNPPPPNNYHPDLVNHVNGPDWKDFWYTWAITIGIKTSLF